MSKFVPINLLSLSYEQSCCGSHRLLEDVYSDQTLDEQTCRNWLERFKRGYIDSKEKERPREPKKFKDKKFEVLLEENSSQRVRTLEEFWSRHWG